MIFTPTALYPAHIIDIELRADDRGFFARTFCSDEFQRHGLADQFVQCSTSSNTHRRTLRGLHFQDEPYPEGKLVRCTRGAIFDVMVDLRRSSPTFCQWVSVELTENNRRAVYAPPGFAHGFQTLEDRSEVYYQMTAAHHPGLARGVRWDDPAFGIDWPLPNPILSLKDASYPNVAR